jgi:transposase-like protein
MRSGPYSEELKQEIIQLNLEEKRSIKSLSMEYGISTSTISRWLTTYRNKHAFNNDSADIKQGGRS